MGKGEFSRWVLTMKQEAAMKIDPRRSKNHRWTQRPFVSRVVLAGLCLLVATAASAGKPGISISVPGVALKNDIIKVHVSASGGSEGVWPHLSGLSMVRGYFDHCGYCGKPCLVNDQVQSCPSAPDGCCFNLYCLGCGWSSGHEFSNSWYGGPTWELKVTGCDTATIQAEYYGGSHEGPFLGEEYEIIILDGIEPGMKVSDTDVCVGEEVDFADDSCGGTHYQWSFGDGHSASGEEVSHSYDTPGLYTVLLTVSSSHDSAQTSSTVTVSGDCATIQGTVTDIVDGSPLPGAHVAVESVPHQRYADSDLDGSYSVSVPPNYTYSINVTRSGYYDSAPDSASPGKNETVTRNFALTPEVQDPIDPLAELGHEWINVDDPVNPATGNFVFSRKLFSMPGKAGLGTTFEVVYNSLDHDADGPLGYGWTHAYNLSLSRAGTDFTLKLADGSRRFFHYDAGAEVYTPYNCRAFGTLANRPPDGWTYTMTGGIVYEFDVQGRLERIVDSRGNAITLSYSTQLDRITDTAGRQIDLTYAGGRLASIASPVAAGDTATFAYDGAGNLTSITDARGNAWTFSYDVSHRMRTEHDRRGLLVLTNVYNGQDRIVSQTDALGHTTTYAATAVGGNRTKVVITPPSGNAVSHFYDESFHLLRSTDGEGHTATFAYAANGSPASITDKLGRVATFEFADDGNLTSVTDRMGGSLQMGYDAHGLLTQSEDDLGNTLNIPRDGKGDPWWIFNPDNNAVQLSANGQGLITYMRDLRGTPWQIGRTGQGQVSTVKDVFHKITVYHYDAAGLVTQVDLPDSFGSVQYERDANGNLVSVTSPGGLVTTYAHDEEDNATAATFVPTGATTGYTYDELGRPHTITDALRGVTTYGYDADSNMVSITDPDGVTKHAAYNARNETISVTSASGSQTSFGYDANGRRTSITDALGHTWSFAHDAEGRLTSTTDPLGHTTSFLRSADEKRTTIVDPAGRETMAMSSVMGDVETVIRPNGDVVSPDRDAGGALERVTDARGKSWVLSRDILGRLVGITDPDGKRESYGHDALGRITGITRRSGDVLAYEYDLDGRLTTTHLPDGTDITYAYVYDATGLTTTITEPLGVTTLHHDLLGRLTQKTDALGNTIERAYTPGGRLASITYPGNHQVVYSYDASGRLDHMTDWLANVTTYHYDALDRVTRIDLPNGMATTFGYDAAGRLISQVHEDGGGTPLVSYAITRDELGRVASMTVTGTPAAAVPDGLREAAYDASNRTVHSSKDLAVSTFTFDADGRQVEKKTGADTVTYGYDALNRLTGVTGGGHTTAYSIDWAGNRLRTVYDGSETRYLRNGNRLWAALDAANVPQQYYIGAGGILYAVDAGGNMRVFHTDPRGNVAAVTDGAGAVSAAFTYDPYGRVLASTGASELTYLGGWGVLADPNGLYQTGMRMYDPEARRFLTEDPLGLQASLNLYGYTSGDPMNSIDPGGGRKFFVPKPRKVFKPLVGYNNEMVRSDKIALNPVPERDFPRPGFRPKGTLRTGVYEPGVSPGKELAVYEGGTNAIAEYEATEAGLAEYESVEAQIAKYEATEAPVAKFEGQALQPSSTGTWPMSPSDAAAVEEWYASSGGDNPNWTQRMVRGIIKRGREIIEDVSLTYTIGKVLLTSDAGELAALGVENPYAIPAIAGGISGRVASAYVPVTFNETTGKWETGDEVVTNYFLPGQISGLHPRAPYVEARQWFDDFLDSIGYSDGLKPNAPAKQ